MRHLKITTLLAFAFTCHLSHAQNNLYLESVEGFTYSNINHSGALGPEDHGRVLGLLFGINASYEFHENIGITSGLSFHQKGMVFKNVAQTDINGHVIMISDNLLRLNYLSLPVLGSFSFGGKVRFLLNAGPYFNFLTNATYTTGSPTFDFFGMNQAPSTNITTAYNRLDIGVHTSAGISISFTERFRLHGLLGHELGLTPIHSNGSSAPKNTSFFLLIGVRFRLNK